MMYAASEAIPALIVPFILPLISGVSLSTAVLVDAHASANSGTLDLSPATLARATLPLRPSPRDPPPAARFLYVTPSIM